MAEYIEREAAIDKTEAFCDVFVTRWTDKKVIAWIKKLPAADVAPVVHGQWENGKCTVCAFDLRGLTDGENDLEQWVWDEGFPYCPNCGAKMDGKSCVPREDGDGND